VVLKLVIFKPVGFNFQMDHHIQNVACHFLVGPFDEEWRGYEENSSVPAQIWKKAEKLTKIKTHI